MRDRMKLPNIVVIVDREGVRTTPRIRMIESKLALLARTFSGDEPWRLVISPTGEIVDVVGFTGNELSVGDVVGPAVLEFMSQVDPRGDNLFVQLVMTVARSIADYGVPVGEIDWDEVHYDFVYPFRGVAGFMGSLEYSSLMLPGAPNGPYRDDVNAYLRTIFLEELQRAYKRSVVHMFLTAGIKFLHSLKELGTAGLVIPEDMNELFEQIAATRPELSPDGQAIEALVGRLFPEAFPELALPKSDPDPETPEPEAPATPEGDGNPSDDSEGEPETK